MVGRGAAAFVVFLVLMAVGCGGSKSLTKAEFVQRAEAVCLDARLELTSLIKAAVAEQKTGHYSEAQLRAQFEPKLAKVRNRQLKELEELRMSDELQATFTLWRQTLAEERREKDSPNRAEHAKAVAIAQRRESLKHKLGIKGECV